MFIVTIMCQVLLLALVLPALMAFYPRRWRQTTNTQANKAMRDLSRAFLKKQQQQMQGLWTQTVLGRSRGRGKASLVAGSVMRRNSWGEMWGGCWQPGHPDPTPGQLPCLNHRASFPYYSMQRTWKLGSEVALEAKVRNLAFDVLRKGRSKRVLCQGVTWFYL